jgi:hypothetical protein
MSRRRTVSVLSVLLVATTMLAGCGNGDEDSDAGPSGRASESSTPTTNSGPSDDGSSDGRSDSDDEDGSTDTPPFPANTQPDTGAASADSFVTVTEIRTGRHDGFDRVVFEVAGTGHPGWDVRYVDEASGQGKGDNIPVEGRAILQVTITGVGYPTETGIEEYDGSANLPGNGTEIVTEVVWDTTFEGTSVAFVGTTEQTPFRVYLLEAPVRVVLDVVHPS